MNSVPKINEDLPNTESKEDETALSGLPVGELVDFSNHEAMLKANIQMQKLLQEKNEFLSIAAHDLKNPLSAIQGFAELMRQHEKVRKHPELDHMVNNIHRSAVIMSEIVRNLLEINKIDDHSIRAFAEPCDLGGITIEAVESWIGRSAEKGITLHMEDHLEGNYAFADPLMVRQVLDNLISNAVKFSPHHRDVWVRVESGLEGFLELTVRDRGPGIAREDRDKLFQRFVKLGNHPTGGENSTGLGLAIVKRLVELNGGFVRHEEAKGGGSIFRVGFPKAP
jgi:signal transduction histidine kinase